MIKSILTEFLTSNVITEQNLESLLGFSYSSTEYVDLFSEITLTMLRTDNYIHGESTVTRQTLRDLFEANPVEYGKLKSGDAKLSGFFIGRAMKSLGPNYNPKNVGLVITEMIKEENIKQVWEL